MWHSSRLRARHLPLKEGSSRLTVAGTDLWDRRSAAGIWPSSVVQLLIRFPLSSTTSRSPHALILTLCMCLSRLLSCQTTQGSLHLARSQSRLCRPQISVCLGHALPALKTPSLACPYALHVALYPWLRNWHAPFRRIVLPVRRALSGQHSSRNLIFGELWIQHTFKIGRFAPQSVIGEENLGDVFLLLQKLLNSQSRRFPSCAHRAVSERFHQTQPLSPSRAPFAWRAKMES